jgi:hypothetical protein
MYLCVIIYIYIIYIPHIYQYYRCEQEGFRSILFFDLRPTASTLPNTTIYVFLILVYTCSQRVATTGVGRRA